MTKSLHTVYNITDPNLEYLHVPLAPICIFLHESGANLYIEIKGSDSLRDFLVMLVTCVINRWQACQICHHV